jgi:hypothetical protein
MDEAGHPYLHPLTLETPKVDQSVLPGAPKLYGGVADWTFTDLGIEYKPMGAKGPHKITITKVHLGTWASRSGLRTGDVIFDLNASSNGYSITFNRDGKTYRALLSKYDGTKLVGKAKSETLTASTTKVAGETKTTPLSTDAHGQSHPSSAIDTIEYGIKITTEVNLALCIPQPTDVYGSGQWDLLFKERRTTGLIDDWEAWQGELRKRLHRDWPRSFTNAGHADMHVVMRSGSVVDVTLIHDTPPGEFADRSISFMRSVHAPFPKQTQVSEIHLEVKFSREPG